MGKILINLINQLVINIHCHDQIIFTPICSVEGQNEVELN